ncbi:MAG: hypothetical protein JWO11_1764 [Nocardioides sp.]|nr:hypothetical protein [Nocardioides sp.]
MSITAGLNTRTWTDADVRALVPAPLFTRLTGRVAREELVSTEQAERIMTQALAFLQACALNPGTALSPSPQVDIGWHAFVLYTRDYAEFCQRVAGRFVHHVPDDDPAEPRRSGPDAIAATVAALRLVGLPVDEDLWQVTGVKCSQCHEGCVDST